MLHLLLKMFTCVAWVCIILGLQHEIYNIIHQFSLVFSNGYVMFWNTAFKVLISYSVTCLLFLSLYLLSVMSVHCPGPSL